MKKCASITNPCEGAPFVGADFVMPPPRISILLEALLYRRHRRPLVCPCCATTIGLCSRRAPRRTHSSRWHRTIYLIRGPNIRPRGSGIFRQGGSGACRRIRNRRARRGGGEHRASTSRSSPEMSSCGIDGSFLHRSRSIGGTNTSPLGLITEFYIEWIRMFSFFYFYGAL